MRTASEPPADDSFARVPMDRRGARYSQRRLLNLISVAAAVLLILVTLPFSLPLGRQMLAQLFPRPPYRGTYAYVGTQYGFLLALRSSDGAVRWRANATHYDGEVEVADGSVITVQPVTGNGQPAEHIVALSASSGQVRWSSPSTQQGLLLLGTEGGAVYAVATSDAATPNPLPTSLLAYDAASGRLRWRYQSPNFGSVGLTPPVNGLTSSLQAGTLFFTALSSGPGVSQTLTALDLATGKSRWQSPLPGPGLGQVIAGNASLLYVEQPGYLNVPGTLAALGATTGALDWQIPLPQDALPAVAGDLVTVGSLGGSQLTAYDVTSGKLRWQRDDAQPIWQAPGPLTALPAGDPLLVNAYNGYAGLDPATGIVRWRGAWPVQTYFSNGQYNPAPVDPAVGDGRYYWFDGQTAFAMSIATGAILWRSSVPPPSSLPSTGGIREYYAGGVLYSIDDNQIFALDGATGRLRWHDLTGAGGVESLQVAP